MYKCAICGMVFEEPEKVPYELCRIDGVPQYANNHLCPDCGSTEFFEVNEDDV